MSNLVNGADFLASMLAEEEDFTESAPAVPRLAFSVTNSVLLALLEKAIMVIPTRDAMPVLKCFQIDATGHRLRITATDCERSIVATTDKADIITSGVAVFPAKKLLDIVKSGGNLTTDVSVTGTTASITIGRASWTLTLQGGEDFPALPIISDAAFLAVDRAALSTALNAVRYAASRDPHRAALNLIDIQDGKLTASDGNRVQQLRLTDFPMTLRIPITTVDDLLRLLKISPLDTVHVGQSDNHLIFRTGTDVFMVNKYVAQFPDLEATMLRPAMENKHALDVDRVVLAQAIKRVRINADDASAIALNLAPGKPPTLTVTARDKYGNTASEVMHCGWTGGTSTIVVNHSHLMEMLSQHPDPACTFKLGENTKTRRSPLMLRASTGSIAVLQQMASDWVTT